MKKLFLIGVAALMAACSSQPETGYTVKVNVSGDLTKLASDTLVMTGGTRKAIESDTVVLAGGKATFKGETKTPSYFTISVLSNNKKSAVKKFFLENAQYVVNVNADDLKNVEVVTDAPAQSFINSVNAKRTELYAAYNIDSLMKVYATLSSDQQQSLRENFEKCENEIKEMTDAYIKENPVSDYALYDLYATVGDIPVAELDSKVAAFDTIPAFAENAIFQEVKETAALIKSLQPGNQAPDFTQNDPDGKPVKFSDIYSKNKLTMVDFWASWCGPCRAFNPDLVKIYKKYHKKGFEIIGVSHDRDYDAWVKGIKDDKLTWPQVSDLKYWENEVGKMYYVRYIPQNIFVDQNGIIVGRQIDKPEVAGFIEEFLKK